jgi:ABC-type amino acid transport substrate-binding protein
MRVLTRETGVIVVAAAFPDPPFEVEVDGRDTGFDVELMQAIGAELGLTVRLVKYIGDDFNGIFDGLAAGRYDAISQVRRLPRSARRSRSSPSPS